jgi:hypothetical protein
MKTHWKLAAAIILLVSVPALADDAATAARPSGLGVGLELGDPNGLTGKYFLNHVLAIDGAMGWGGPFTVHADLLWHGWNALPKPSEGRLPVYLGVGLEIEDGNAALRTVGGVSYWLKDKPLEIFAELAPTFGADEDAELAGAIGFRWYFTRFN